MPADIRTFFDAYRDAFNRLDGHAVSAHYDTPAMIHIFSVLLGPLESITSPQRHPCVIRNVLRDS